MSLLKASVFFYANDVRNFHGNGVAVIDVPALAILLSSLFAWLLEQPQLSALCVCESPLSACALIKKFLTTPTSHEQTLYVEGLDEQDLMRGEEDNCNEEEQEEITSDSDKDTFVVKRQRITKQRKKLPERIGSCFTWSRDISFFPRDQHTVQVSWSGLFFQHYSLIAVQSPWAEAEETENENTDTAINVEHIVLFTQTCTCLAHLKKFTISNP